MFSPTRNFVFGRSNIVRDLVSLPKFGYLLDFIYFPAYRDLMGVDRFEHASRSLEALMAMRRERPVAGGMPLPWIVPRITRCDRVYDELEAFS